MRAATRNTMRLTLTPEDLQFVITWQDEWFAHYPMLSVARRPGAPPWGPGVPRAMWNGYPDSAGWVAWKFVPATLTDEALAALEATLPGPFPPLFRAYALARALCDAEVGGVRLPAFPIERPLEDLQGVIEANATLVAAGYVPIGWDTNDEGPVCFDMSRRHADGDCPLVGFHHEADWSGGRASLERIAKPLFESFRALLTDAAEDARQVDAGRAT